VVRIRISVKMVQMADGKQHLSCIFMSCGWKITPSMGHAKKCDQCVQCKQPVIGPVILLSAGTMS